MVGEACRQRRPAARGEGARSISLCSCAADEQDSVFTAGACGLKTPAFITARQPFKVSGKFTRIGWSGAK
jgi:hypothetical protein